MFTELHNIIQKRDSFIEHETMYRLKEHIKNHDIPVVAIQNPVSNILDFVTKVYNLYTSNNEDEDSMLKKIINCTSLCSVEMSLLMCGSSRDEQYRAFNTFLNRCAAKQLDHILTVHFFLNALSKLTCRSVSVMLHNNFQPFTHIGQIQYLSNIIIGFDNNQFQLFALKEKFRNILPFSTKNVENLSPKEILTTFQRLQKRNPEKIHCGGAYVKTYTEPIRNAPIFIKELYSIFIALSYFEEYFSLNHVIVVTDNQASVHVFKNLKSKDFKKANRYLSILNARYGNIPIIHVPSKQNLADILSRTTPNDIVTIQQHFSVQTDGRTDGQNVNLIRSAFLEEYYDSLCNYDVIRAKQMDECGKLFKDKNYRVSQNNILMKDSKIVLPSSLNSLIIAKFHVKKHGGIRKTENAIKDVYHIYNNSDFVQKLHNIIGSCIACTNFNQNNKKYILGSSWKNTHKVGDILCLDFMELSKIRSSSNFSVNYILIMLDPISNYVTTYYASKMNTAFVITSLLNYFATNGFYKYILSDNASYFRSPLFKKFLKEYDIKLCESATQRPSSHGRIEATVKKVRHLSRILSSKDISKMPLHSPMATLIINSQPFGKRMNLNPYIVHHLSNSNIDNSNKIVDAGFLPSLIEKYDALKDKINDAIHELREDQINELAKKNKKRYAHKFKLNQLVVFKNFAYKDANKFQVVPYRVVKVSKFLITGENILTKILVQRHASDTKVFHYLQFDDIPEMIQNNFYRQDFKEQLIEQLREDAETESKSTRILRSKIKKDRQTEHESDSDSDHVTFELF